MSAGSTKFTVSRIAALSLVSLWLAGCTNTNNPPAPVSSAGGAASSSTNSGMLITPPPSGVKSAPQAQPIQPMQTQTIQPQPAPVAQEPVQTVNGRIVYNRKYGDIPKGSYTGGSTYTVKRGDTLFYIAWVTGNDFRDLAQRNNIPAPYALNVGQVLQVGNAQPSRLQAVRQPVRRSQHGAGRLMARLSRTLAARKAAIKVSILQAVRDRLLSRPPMGASSMPVTHCAATVILLSSNTTMIT